VLWKFNEKTQRRNDLYLHTACLYTVFQLHSRSLITMQLGCSHIRGNIRRSNT